MRTDILEKKLVEVKQQYGVGLFEDGNRLCSALADISTEIRSEIVFIKTFYRYTGAEMSALVLALEQNNGTWEDIVVSIQRKADAAFLSGQDVSALLFCVVRAFQQDASAIVPKQYALSLIRMEELSKALADLDDKYKDDLWKQGDILASLLSDCAPNLVTERRLILRVYEIAGNEIRRLIRALVRREEETAYIEALRSKLKEACIDLYYIDAFLTTVVEKLFGATYQYVLKESSVPSTDDDNTVTQKSAPKKKSKHRFLKFCLLILICVVIVKWKPGLKDVFKDTQQSEPGTEETVKEESKASEVVVSETEASESETQISTEEETVISSEEEDKLYIPSADTDVWIESVEATVYGENVTDLHNYSLYEAPTDAYFFSGGTPYTFAYPTQLYTEVIYDESNRTYEFTGDDGSYLGYRRVSSSGTIYKPSEFRELLLYGPGTLAKSLSDIEVLSVNDSGTESCFYVTAKDGDLNVVIICSYYVKRGEGMYMLLKYPDPESEEERLAQEYYIECLYILNEFTDSDWNGYYLRSYEDFINE